MRLRTLFCASLAFLFAAPCFALEKQPAAEYHARRVALGEKLKGGAALIFAANEPKEEYLSWRQDEDFYYLTGWNEPGAALLVEAAVPATPAGYLSPATPAEPYREILFLPTRNGRMERYTGVKLGADTAGAPGVAGVDEVMPITELPHELDRMSKASGILGYLNPRVFKLYAATDETQTNATLTVLAASLGVGVPPAQDLRGLVAQLRWNKSLGELDLLRKASDASIAAHRALFASIKPGASERTMSGLIDYKLKENGCERPSYPSIVGSGANSTVLHYSADENTMQAGDLVVVDAAGEYSMYASDVTRTFPVSGHFTPRQREIYEIVLGAQRAAMAAFVSGKSYMGNRNSPNNADSLDKIAFDYINTHGKDLHGEPLGQYFIHGLGHSVGIDVHDPYDYTKPFGPGAVFTIEPGIYIPEEKIGVRIEDTFYVDANGKLMDFIADLPHTPEEVEAAMNPQPRPAPKKH